MIEPIADHLGVPVHRIYANTLLFSAEDGSYAGFDESEPTSRDGGKPAVVQQLIHAHGYGPVGERLVHTVFCRCFMLYWGGI